MKDYPVDKWFHVMFWPLNAARGRAWQVRILGIVAFFVWWLLISPISFVLLLVSILMALWDELSEPIR